MKIQACSSILACWLSNYCSSFFGSASSAFGSALLVLLVQMASSDKMTSTFKKGFQALLDDAQLAPLQKFEALMAMLKDAKIAYTMKSLPPQQLSGA